MRGLIYLYIRDKSINHLLKLRYSLTKYNKYNSYKTPTTIWQKFSGHVELSPSAQKLWADESTSDLTPYFGPSVAKDKSQLALPRIPATQLLRTE